MKRKRLSVEALEAIAKKAGRGTIPAAHHFKKGNELSKAENLSDEANEGRLRGLLKRWEVAKEEGPRTHEEIKALQAHNRRQRKIYEKVALEAHEVQRKARMSANDAMDTLDEIVKDPSAQHSARIAAAQVILERAYGKASQVNINAQVNPDAKNSEVTDKQLDERIRQTLKRVEELTGGEAKPTDSKEQPADVRESDRDTGGSTVH